MAIMEKSSLVDRLSLTAVYGELPFIDHLSSMTGMVKSSLERSQRRKPPHWRMRAKGGYGGKGQGRRCSKMSLRSTIAEMKR